MFFHLQMPGIFLYNQFFADQENITAALHNDYILSAYFLSEQYHHINYQKKYWVLLCQYRRPDYELLIF